MTKRKTKFTLKFKILNVDLNTGTCEVIWNDDERLRVNMSIPVDAKGKALTGLALKRALVQDMLPELRRRNAAQSRDFKSIVREVGKSHRVSDIFDELVELMEEAEEERLSQAQTEEKINDA